jgi:hypothetical protein
MGMIGKRSPWLVLALPGLLFIALGALIVIEPRIVVWLFAGAVAVMGAVLLALAGFARNSAHKRP